MLRLFNEKEGQRHLEENGVSKELISKLHLLGISGIGNLIAAIKFAKYNELDESDYVATVCTDSMQLYGSRIKELAEERGEYRAMDAHKDYELVNSISIDH